MKKRSERTIQLSRAINRPIWGNDLSTERFDLRERSIQTTKWSERPIKQFELSELSWADSSELIWVEMTELSREQLIISGPMVHWCKDTRDTLFFRTMHISDMEWMVLKELTVSGIGNVFAYSIQEVTLTLRPKLDCCRLAGGGETDGYWGLWKGHICL